MGMGGADGTWAQYLKAPAKSVWKIDRSIPSEIATFMEPLGNAVYASEEGQVAGKDVAIFGCGPVGLFTVGTVKAMGAANVYAVDLSDYRLDIAKKMGADRVINPANEDALEIINSETSKRGVDVAMDMAGAQATIEQTLKSVKKSGQVIFLGLPSKPVTIDWSNLMVLKDLKMKGIYGRQLFRTWETGTDLLMNKGLDISPVNTHSFKLEEHEKAMQVMMSGQSGKIRFEIPE